MYDTDLQQISVTQVSICSEVEGTDPFIWLIK